VLIASAIARRDPKELSRNNFSAMPLLDKPAAAPDSQIGKLYFDKSCMCFLT
jgi:hypothetical protein